MCGIVGILGSKKASFEAYQALLLLQHRGQDAAGIVSYNTPTQEFNLIKNHGLVGQVFKEVDFDNLHGDVAIAHTRYATVANKSHDTFRDIQPLMVNFPHGLAIVHNGNIVNIDELKDILRSQHQRQMLTNNDAEVLLNLLSSSLQASLNLDPLKQLEIAASHILQDAMGGYAIIGVWGNGMMFGLRDPHGIRPLCLGKKNEKGRDIYIFSSESNTLEFLGYEFLRDVQPGEMIIINKEVILESNFTKNTKKKFSPCMFEWVYFATPESVIDGQSVYQTRLNLGNVLADKIKKMIINGEISPEVIVPVPDSGRIAAVALSEKLNLPYRELLIKNRYIQRSFILKNKSERAQALSLKLMSIKAEIKGKKILVVDDSIVRGATSKKIVETLRLAGAKEIYFVSTCPPIKSPCYFGVDFPLESELIAANLSGSELEGYLGVEKVIYQDLASLKEALKLENSCDGCLTGSYPFEFKNSAKKFQQQRKNTEDENVWQIH